MEQRYFSFYEDLFEARSPLWPKLREEHLKKEPFCQICGKSNDLEVHHKIPVSLCPNRELDPSNLITLCSHHHWLFGHCKRWDGFNPDIDYWVEAVRKMISSCRFVLLPSDNC